jgi:hypothetical protein
MEIVDPFNYQIRDLLNEAFERVEQNTPPKPPEPRYTGFTTNNKLRETIIELKKINGELRQKLSELHNGIIKLSWQEFQQRTKLERIKSILEN